MNYEIDAQCTNCEQAVKVTLPKGTPFDCPQECPNCGCKTAIKKRTEPTVKEATIMPFWLPEPPPSKQPVFSPPHWLDQPAQPWAEIHCEAAISN